MSLTSFINAETIASPHLTSFTKDVSLSQFITDEVYHSYARSFYMKFKRIPITEME